MILADLANSITNLELGFTKTFLDFLRDPGLMIERYLNGATRNYMKPFRYTFIWATVATIVMIYSGVYDMQQEAMAEFMASNGYQGQGSELEATAQSKVQELTKKFMNFLMLVAIPFNAFGTWIMFQASKLNYQDEKVKYKYADHLIINTYITGTVAAIGLLATLFYAICPQFSIWGSVSGLIIGQVFSYYVFLKVFRQHWILTLMNAMLANFISLLLGSILIGGVAILGGVIYAMMNV